MSKGDVACSNSYWPSGPSGPGGLHGGQERVRSYVYVASDVRVRQGFQMNSLAQRLEIKVPLWA